MHFSERLWGLSYRHNPRTTPLLEGLSGIQFISFFHALDFTPISDPWHPKGVKSLETTAY